MHVKRRAARGQGAEVRAANRPSRVAARRITVLCSLNLESSPILIPGVDVKLFSVFSGLDEDDRLGTSLLHVLEIARHVNNKQTEVPIDDCFPDWQQKHKTCSDMHVLATTCVTNTT